MARRLQIFTRLHEDKIEVLEEIGQEMIDEGEGTEVELLNPQGGINLSEVIRRLLAKADRRLADD